MDGETRIAGHILGAFVSASQRAMCLPQAISPAHQGQGGP